MELHEEKKKKESNLKVIKANLQNYESKQELLEDIPCGNKYPNCKFICDANKAKNILPQIRKDVECLVEVINGLGEKLSIMDINDINEQISKYNKIVSKVSSIEAEIIQLKHKIEKNELKIISLDSEIQEEKRKETLYEENKEVIENLETLHREKKGLESSIKKKKILYDECNQKVQNLLVEEGATKQNLKILLEDKKELEELESQWVAYDLFMQCMHPNGIPYNIIKQKLPLLNEEISKILANIVDFEIFFENNDKKLDINIKHPFYDARPLSMGSGAEKTIAAMAIRLALISVTNLPKSELFILDEPATALDQDHMEGFVRLLDMIKNQFKTVILISHLDSLKDIVDMTIDISKIDGYAKVSM